MKTANWRVVIMSILVEGLAAGSAAAQPFPWKPVELVVPFPPGGSSDAVARALVTPLSKALGQSVVVLNRAGGNMVIGARLVARAPADGHTVLIGGVGTMALRSNLPFDPIKDFAAVARIGTQPYVLSVHPSLPVKSVKELVALAHAHPGELTYSVNGYGTNQHLCAELLKLRTRISMKPVVFQGGAPSAMAVLGGHVSILMSTIAPIAEHVPTGKLRALAVTSSARSDALKDVPTMMESGIPDFDMTGMMGVLAPAATPKAAIDRLSAEIVRAVQLPDVKAKLRMQGYSVAPAGADEHAADILARIQKLKKLIKAVKIKVN